MYNSTTRRTSSRITTNIMCHLHWITFLRLDGAPSQVPQIIPIRRSRLVNTPLRFVTSDAVVAIELWGDGAVTKWRQLVEGDLRPR